LRNSPRNDTKNRTEPLQKGAEMAGIWNTSVSNPETNYSYDFIFLSSSRASGSQTSLTPRTGTLKITQFTNHI